MKIVTNKGNVKIITDTVECSSLYLNPSFEFDTKFGSINGAFRMLKKDYEKSELKNAIDMALDIALQKAKKENEKVADKIVSLPKAIEDDNDPNYVIFKFKNKAKIEHNGELIDRKLRVVDSRGNPINDYESLTAGTKARISFNVVPWYMPSRKESSISFWVQGIQVIEPNFYEGGSDFDTIDNGYVANNVIDNSNVAKNMTNDELMDSLEELM